MSLIYIRMSLGGVANGRNVPTLFRCRLSTNDGSNDKYERVKALSDGALCLVTNEPKRDVGMYYWNGQRTVLALEVPFPPSYYPYIPVIFSPAVAVAGVALRLLMMGEEIGRGYIQDESMGPTTIFDRKPSDRAEQILAEML
jgi:hypothetical protein